MLKTYVKIIDPAQYRGTCAVCDTDTIPGDKIYWHGSVPGNKQLGRVSHFGCFWDPRRGEAPHVIWEQIANIANAVIGHKLPNDPNVRRFMGAVRLALKNRPIAFYRGDQDAGIRMGPDLLDGYRKVSATLEFSGERWAPREANGSVLWKDATDAPPAPPKPKAQMGARVYGWRGPEFLTGAKLATALKEVEGA